MNRQKSIILILILGLCTIGVAQFSAPAVGQTEFDHLFYLPSIQHNYPPPPEPATPHILQTIRLPHGAHPHGIALDVTGQRAFVANNFRGTLSVLNTATMQAAYELDLPGAVGPHGVDYHAELDRVYVSNEWSNTLSILDPTARAVTAAIGMGERPYGVGVRDDLVYVSNFAAETVTVLHAPSQTISATIPVGDRPAHIAADDDRGPVYVAGHGSDRILTLQEGQLTGVIDGVPFPYGVAFDPITGYLYAGARAEHRLVTIRDTADPIFGTDVGTVAEPFVIGVNPRTGHIFVVCGNEVRVYDRRDNALLTTIPIGGGATDGIAVDPTRNLVYVTSGDTDSVIVIQDVAAHDIVYGIWKQTGQLLLTDHLGEHGYTLTEPYYYVGYPQFSPDGRSIAFVSYDGQEQDIQVMAITGGDWTNLTPDVPDTEDTQPSWSPDGTQIVWRRNWEIWVMDADGSNKQRLTPEGVGARSPVWSPDGQWIAFIAWHHDTGATAVSPSQIDDPQAPNVDPTDLLIVPASGGDYINLTDNGLTSDDRPTWSPDGAQLAYMAQGGENFGETSDIYIADITDLDNITLTPLTTDPAWDASPAWSPDGQWIAFVTNRQREGYDYDVFITTPAGNVMRRVSDGQVTFYDRPQWSPDGRYLAAIGRAGDPSSQIFTMNVATGAMWQTTTHGFNKTGFDFRP